MKPRSAAPKRQAGLAQLRAPPRLSVHELTVGADDFAILEWPVAPPRSAPSLTPAEREVLDLVCAGLSNREIGRRRGTSERTVANQVQSLHAKLGVRSRLELFAWRAREG